MKKTLECLAPGEWGVVSSIEGEEGMIRRLNDLGFITGTKVNCLHKSPLGDPVAFGVRGAVIALRWEDLKNVYIKN